MSNQALAVISKRADAFRRFGRRQVSVSAIMIVLAIIAFFTFSYRRIEVDASDGAIYAVRYTWWGSASKEREIRWMKAPGYDFEGWMTKNEKGEWYLYISDDDYSDAEPPDYH